jgi:hypothetical protein
VNDPWLIPSRDIDLKMKTGHFADSLMNTVTGDLVSAVDDPALSKTDETIKVYPNLVIVS